MGGEEEGGEAEVQGVEVQSVGRGAVVLTRFVERVASVQNRREERRKESGNAPLPTEQTRPVQRLPTHPMELNILLSAGRCQGVDGGDVEVGGVEVRGENFGRRRREGFKGEG